MENFTEIVKNKTNDELLQMVYEFAEWSPEMLTSVEEELAHRNILPDDVQVRKEQLTELEDERLLQGKEASILGQVIGWLTVLGIFGIFIGHHYSFSKVRNKYSGKQYYRYNEHSRKSGSYLFYTAIILLTLEILYNLLKGHPI
jgi:hypothetical protein